MRVTGPFLTRALGAAAFVTIAATAGAQDITFSTQGCFGMNCGSLANPFTTTASLVAGGYTITFNGLASSTVSAAPSGFTNTSLGTFQVTGSGAPATIGSTNFSLQVVQSNPGPFSGSSDGTLAGTISFNQSTVTVTMNGFPFTVGPVIYALFPQNSFDLVPPTSNNGVTTVQALLEDTRITGAVVPEPSTYALMATGLAVLGGVAARRRRTS